MVNFDLTPNWLLIVTAECWKRATKESGQSSTTSWAIHLNQKVLFIGAHSSKSYPQVNCKICLKSAVCMTIFIGFDTFFVVLFAGASSVNINLNFNGLSGQEKSWQIF